jgi:hypothetical protein
MHIFNAYHYTNKNEWRKREKKQARPGNRAAMWVSLFFAKVKKEDSHGGKTQDERGHSFCQWPFGSYLR